MPKFTFNKLVRDRIVEHQLASGASPQYKVLTSGEHRRELVRKLNEEAAEVLSADPQNVAAELADAQQVLDDLMRVFGVSREQVEKERRAKLAKNGGFGGGLFVSFVEVPEGDKWADYYRQNPEQYPEVK